MMKDVPELGKEVSIQIQETFQIPIKEEKKITEKKNPLIVNKTPNIKFENSKREIQVTHKSLKMKVDYSAENLQPRWPRQMYLKF